MIANITLVGGSYLTVHDPNEIDRLINSFRNKDQSMNKVIIVECDNSTAFLNADQIVAIEVATVNPEPNPSSSQDS